MNTYYIDGTFVSETDATISVNDMSVLRGYGVFDFLRTYNRRPFYLDAHIERLARSARLVDLAMPWSQEQIHAITMETLDRNDHEEANIRLVITGGVSPDSITPANNPKLLILVTGLHTCPAEWYQEGAAIITTHDQRYMPGAKSINYIPAILALSRARQQGAIESIYIDKSGRVLEGTTTNIFAFIGDTLVTPANAILPGITRQVIISLVKDPFDLEIRDIHQDEIRLMDEVFVTASNKEVVPVVRMNDRRIGDGTPGDRTRHIMQLFADYTRQYGQQGA
jgi:branched-chain amino acid aminotransferase